MLKILGLVLIVAAGTGAGFWASTRLQRRVTVLEAVDRFLLYIAGKIRYTAAPVPDIVSGIVREGKFSELPFLRGVAGCGAAAFHETWRRELLAWQRGGPLLQEDVELLLDFGEKTGTSDLDGQIENCRMYQGLLDVRLKDARSAAREKGRLYMTLGLIGGMALALLLA